MQYLLAGDTAYHQVQACDRIVSSELLEIECWRTLHRERSIGALNDVQFDRCCDALAHLLSETDLLQLSRAIKRRAAEAFPVHVKTLDALHLATALAIAQEFPDETVAVFSYDQTMNRAAKVLGLAAPWYQR